MFKCDDSLLDAYNVVYKIENLVNGKFYIGKTEQVLRIRLRRHMRHVRDGTNRHLYDAVRKYGEENFRVSIMEEVTDPNLLCQMEVKLIDNYGTMNRNIGYNMTVGGLGGRLPQEAYERMAEKKRGVPLSEEHRRNISEALKGHPSHTTPKSAKKISATMKERGIRPPTNPTRGKFGEQHHFFGKHHTEETKRRMSEYRKANPVTLSPRDLERRSNRWLGEGNPNYKPIDRDGLAEDVLNELQIKQMAEKYSVSRPTIHNKLKKCFGSSSIALVREILSNGRKKTSIDSGD